MPSPLSSPPEFTAPAAFLAISLYPWHMNTLMSQNWFSPKVGLVLSDGADRGKVNIDATYLSVEGLGLKTVDLTADLAVAGANGLDTGSEAASTWYSVWVISTATGSEVASLLSLSATAPTLPARYALKRRVGWVRNNSGSNLYRFTHRGEWFTWNEVVSAAPFLVLSTTAAAVAFTDVNLAPVVPPTSRLVGMGARVVDGIVFSSAVHVKNKDHVNILYALNVTQVSASAGSIGSSTFTVGCNAAQVVQYRGNVATNDIDLCVTGYEDIT